MSEMLSSLMWYVSGRPELEHVVGHFVTPTARRTVRGKDEQAVSSVRTANSARCVESRCRVLQL